MTISTFDRFLERVEAGETLSPDDIHDLARTPDVLPLGMMADVVRRRLRGTTVTYLRVSSAPFDQSMTATVLPAAREVRVTGSPESLSVARNAIRTAREIAGDRVLSAFGWADVSRLAEGGSVHRVLEDFRIAGLDAVADLPLDEIADLPAALEALTAAGFERLRLGIARIAAAERTQLLLKAAELQDEFACVQSLNPLPSVLSTFRPTTGYEDVKMVAIARLAAPNIPTIQVDWPRYGPKLAQVALTFGADDLYGVAASDEAPEGRRRAPLEEIRRNIEAAGFQPAERDGRFNLLS